MPAIVARKESGQSKMGSSSSLLFRGRLPHGALNRVGGLESFQLEKVGGRRQHDLFGHQPDEFGAADGDMLLAGRPRHGLKDDMQRCNLCVE